jgi:predicted AlkP superfamily pyrophosphatase or phosphodiesterase
MIKRSFVSFLLFFSITVNIAIAQSVPRPKLVVGIVVDQMRWDFLYRYYDRYSPGGFKRLLTSGFSCENTFIPYTPTKTAPGHASIFTGSVPAIHGIVANDWYRRDLRRTWYCAEDTTVETVGSQSKEGRMSPANINTTTITDELRLATNFRNKTIGIALKDRGGILPAGHTANAAYWFDNTTGGWISSTYYMKELPDWVKKINDKKLPDKYLQQNWETLYPIDTYTQSTADHKTYEVFTNGDDVSFPHVTSGITEKKYDVFRHTPYGNTYTLELAKAAIAEEKLGQGKFTDFLTISFSATDYIGHYFSPNSIEVEDTYLRLDKDLAELLNYLDTKVGKGQYLLFLSADHGAPQAPDFLKENKVPAGMLSFSTTALNEKAEKKFGVKSLIERIMNAQVYINYPVLQQNNISEKVFKEWVMSELRSNPAVLYVLDMKELDNTTLPSRIKEMATLGYNPTLCGDIQYILKPQWIGRSANATDHGNWNPYDSHIPLLWYGWGIKPGKTNRETYMTDIAPTVAALLRIQMPSGTIGRAIEEVMK